MSAEFLCLTAFALIFTWLYAIYKIKKSYVLINPYIMWIIAIGYFIVIPFSTLLLNGGFSGPQSHGQYADWAQINLNTNEFFYPTIFIFIAVELQLVFSIFLSSQKSKKRITLVSNFNRVLPAFITLSTFYYLISVILLGGYSEYFSTNWYERSGIIINHYGTYGIIFVYISGCIQAIAIGFLTRQFITKNINVHTILLVMLIITNIFMSGNRIFLVIFLLIIATQAYLLGRYKFLIIISLLAPLFYLFSHYWLSIRDSNLEQVSIGQSALEESFNTISLASKVIEVTEGANIMLLLNIIKDVDQSNTYLYGETLIRPITFFIPKYIYEDRIKSFTVLTYEKYENIDGGSFSSSILGELYSNFSYFSGILFLLITLALYRISNFLQANINIEKYFLYSTSSSVFIIFMARSVFSDNIIYILMLLFFTRLLEKR